MYQGIPCDETVLLSDEEVDVCDFQDHPYSSPSEESENDIVIEEMDFSVFSMHNIDDSHPTLQQNNESIPPETID